MTRDLVLAEPGEVRTEWLTEVLRTSGALDQGRVTDVRIAGDDSTHAATARLLIHYSPDATITAPRSLFLKICKAEGASYFGRTEIDLYTKIGAPLEDGPIPRCYHVGYDDESGRYHLLLEDLSETHHPNWEVDTPLESACNLAAGLATMHAYWWDRRELREDDRYPTAEDIRSYRGHLDQGYAPMLAHLGDQIGDETRAILAQIFDKHERRMLARAEEGRHLTFVHGDANPGNILSPNEPGGKEYVVDRQLFSWSLGVWLGVSDVAYMMVTWWSPEKRRLMERRVLEAYHGGLHEHGVRDYSWEKLWKDYRLTAVQSFYVATAWCIDDQDRVRMEWLWRVELERSLAAYRELGIAEIIR